MKNKIITLAIIKEARVDENRTPLSPTQITNILDKFSNIKIIVQPSNRRCFKDEDYLKAGAKITDDLSPADIIFGVKEVDISTLIKNKTYFFFSHTSKVRQYVGQIIKDKAIIYKKELLREVIKKKITLIDYENLRDVSGEGYRYLGFGRFAGIVGTYNTLNLYLKLFNEQPMPRAFEINNYEQIKKIIDKKNFNSYLEIGCYLNETFSKVQIEKKIGVDPISGGTVRQKSNDFFLNNKDFFDLIFIDGDHDYKQAIKDINNSIDFLNDNGIILVHDCLPSSFFQQAVPRCQYVWTGNVWKAVAMIRTNPNLNTCVCSIDHGIAIISKKPNKNILNVPLKKIEQMSYKDFFFNYKKLLNVISFNDVDELI